MRTEPARNQLRAAHSAYWLQDSKVEPPLYVRQLLSEIVRWLGSQPETTVETNGVERRFTLMRSRTVRYYRLALQAVIDGEHEQLPVFEEE